MNIHYFSALRDARDADATGIMRAHMQICAIMPTIDTIAREIREFEGFAVRIRHTAVLKSAGAEKRNVPGYKRRYDRIAWNTFTVNDWRRRRFDNDYPGYAVDVLKPDGKVATGSTGLAKLRALYERNSN